MRSFGINAGGDGGGDGPPSNELPAPGVTPANPPVGARGMGGLLEVITMHRPEKMDGSGAQDRANPGCSRLLPAGRVSTSFRAPSGLFSPDGAVRN